MPRKERIILSRDLGVMHIYSKVAGGEFLLGPKEKEQLLRMLERFSSGFLVTIHEFAIMSNHFHLVISEGRQDAAAASKEELIQRYRRIYGDNSDPPIGRQLPNGRFIPDEDEGIERLRRRLGSVSAFVQELKQRFSLWYNKENKRKGYFWGGRFGSSLVERGDAAMVTGSYLNLNPVRANLVKTPDEYRWCGLGLWARNRKRARNLLSPMPVQPGQTPLDAASYRLFVYHYGNKPISGECSIDPTIVAQVDALCGRIGLLDLAGHRIRNFSEGIALGSFEFITRIQTKIQSPSPKARRVHKSLELYCPRVLV